MNIILSRLLENRRHLLLLAAFACYFLFSILHPFLHDHVIDGHMHDDCGACLWFVISSVIFILALILALLFTVFGRYPDEIRDTCVSNIYFPPPARSPPLS